MRRPSRTFVAGLCLPLLSFPCHSIGVQAGGISGGQVVGVEGINNIRGGGSSAGCTHARRPATRFMSTRNRLIWALVAALCVHTALADGIGNAQVIGGAEGIHNGSSSSSPPASGNDLLLEDGVSFLLLEDGSSKLCLESGC